MTTTKEEENDEIKNEIEQIKLEALNRLNDLDSQLSSSSKEVVPNNTVLPKVINNHSSSNVVMKQSKPKKQDALTLLNDTRWKLSLDIGREEGTWMPKTWGVSGNRLILNMEIEFTQEQLYEREEFLGGLGGARILKVCDNQMILAPTIREGIRKIECLEGGWRIGKGEGPKGTDILRFYLEVEDKISRENGDVYCPPGRIYCNCGYFPFMTKSSSGVKERIRTQLDIMAQTADDMTQEIENDTAFFSFDKIKKSADLLRLKVEMQQIGERYSMESVREPDRSLLKCPNDVDVGLTKEGGICCKVEKAIGTEYHILGRLRIASADSRVS